jgi:subtilase family serine protease
VDDVNRIGEGNEANNKLVVPLSIGIDLVVTSAAPSGSNISVGTQVSFVATVKNVGTIATPPGVIVGVAFQVDGTLVSWSDSDTQSLAPGASINLLVNSGPSGVAFWTATSGTHSVQAWVDDVNRMNDVNRSNNKRTFSLIVQ